jgi:hypothetical protein
MAILDFVRHSVVYLDKSSACTLFDWSLFHVYLFPNIRNRFHELAQIASLPIHYHP